MQVRQPSFDFSRTSTHWAPDREFAQAQNAASVGIPPLERFLNRVMAKARKQIAGDDPESVRLRADINIFIRQESCHYSNHEMMNAVLKRDGYDRIAEFEREFEAHYDRLLSTKSLAFLSAYCEGFETLGPAAAMTWCGDGLDHYLHGADPNVEMLFRWHLMEEYEHRHVCYDVFHRLHGGYFLRIYGFFYQLYCLTKMTNKVKKYLLATDRAAMNEQELKASKKREKAVNKAFMKTLLGGLGKVLLPSYRPHTLMMPKNLDRIRAEVDAKWMA